MCSEGLRERYVNPYTDFAFKLLFGTDLNKEILIGFLNALFDGKQVIEDVIWAAKRLTAGLSLMSIVKMKKEKRF